MFYKTFQSLIIYYPVLLHFFNCIVLSEVGRHRLPALSAFFLSLFSKNLKDSLSQEKQND